MIRSNSWLALIYAVVCRVLDLPEPDPPVLPVHAPVQFTGVVVIGDTSSAEATIRQRRGR